MPHDELESRLRAELAPEIEVQKRLGSSATAAVFLARERALRRLVVVKALRPPAQVEQAGEVAHARFEREARSAALLEHPNVVAVHRYGRLSDGTPYLIMQHVKGRTLRERLTAEGPLPSEEVRWLLADVAAALAAAHGRNIVHRNVQPGTVLWEQETGRALLSDFGIVAVLDQEGDTRTRLTRTGEVVGDPRYISPEGLTGRELTPAADLYSLGLLGYELLTEESPYGDFSPGRLIAAHLEDSPRPLRSLRSDVDPTLADLLARCLAKAPEHRPDAAFVARTLGRDAAHAGPDRTTASTRWMGETVEGLLRRRLPQFVLASAAGGWLLLQMVDQLVQQEVLPQPTYPLTLTLVGFGLGAVGVVSWFHGEAGAQKPRALEIWLLAGLGALWIITSSLILL